MALNDNWKSSINLPEHSFKQVPAFKRPGPGRPAGGLILFNKRSLNHTIIHYSRRFIVSRIVSNSVHFLLACVYLSPDDDVGSSLAILSELLEGEENVLAIGDLNYRIGCDGNNLSPEEITNDLFTHRRASLDSTINPRGHVLTQYLADGGLVVLNGRSPSDPVGNLR